MRVAGWVGVVAAALAALTLGCRQPREAPPADAAVPPPSAPDAASMVARPVAPDVAPEVGEPIVPVVSEDPVPAGAEPWLGYADGRVRVADADGDRELLEGQAVLPGTIVWVDDFAQAELDLPDGSLADLDELTELVVQKVLVGGNLRLVELAVLGGAARFVVAPSLETASAFQVSTPVGVLEAAAGQFSVDVDIDRGATMLVVHAGRVVVRSGTAERVVTGQGPAVGTLELPAVGELRDVELRPELMDRWTLWDERQGDRLLDQYALDPAAPWTQDVPALSLDLHPQWASTLQVRRNRVEARARVLTDALVQAGMAFDADPRVLQARARDVLGPLVDLPRQNSALSMGRAARLARWRAREQTRAERRDAMRPQLARLRAGGPPSPAPEQTPAEPRPSP